MAVYTIKVCAEKNNNFVVVYSGNSIVRVMKCSSAKDEKGAYNFYTKTGNDYPKGRTKSTITEKTESSKSAPYWHALNGNSFGQYCSRIGPHAWGLLFHSVPYYSTSHKNLEVEEFNKLGKAASLGCIRLCVRDAKWIYENCDVGSSVEVVSSLSVGQEPLFVPTITEDPVNPKYGWDPTDPVPENPYGEEYTGDEGGNPYPYILDEQGHFIDKEYPNLASPEFIHIGSKVSYNGETITGTCSGIGASPRSSALQSELKTKYGIDFPMNSSVLPNCVGYVKARWMQFSGGIDILSNVSGDASTYYNNANTAQFEKSNTTPKLGAIACWGSNHVAIVERINDDGSFYVSESGYPMTKGSYDHAKAKTRMLGLGQGYQKGVRSGYCSANGSRTDGYGSNFQGFIYYPGDFVGGAAGMSRPVWEDLYSEPVERTDATLRTVGNLSSVAYAPTQDEKTSTKAKVAVVNYTPTLQAIYNYKGIGWTGSGGGFYMDGPYSENITNTDFDTDGCAGMYKRQDVVNCLLNLGFSRVQVAGICGNILQESTYRPWSVEGDYNKGRKTISWENRYTGMDTSDEVEEIKNNPANAGKWGIGLLAWTFPDYEISMVAYCEQNGKPWYETVEYQLKFFAEVQLGDSSWSYGDYKATDGGVKGVLQEIQGFPNTEAGARACCEAFMRKYERPAEATAELGKRQDEAAFVFRNIIPYQKKDGNNTGSVSGGSGTRKAETR